MNDQKAYPPVGRAEATLWRDRMARHLGRGGDRLVISVPISLVYRLARDAALAAPEGEPCLDVLCQEPVHAAFHANVILMPEDTSP